jgi:TPR repeat protein
MSTIEQANIAYEAGDYETAFQLLMPLAQAGDLSAQMSIAGMYSTGNGVAQNFAEAAKWYRPAAERGLPIAQNNLAAMLLCSDPEEAIQWLLSAAEKDVPFAQSMLGDIYSDLYNLPSNIQGGIKNSSEAVKWYQRAGKNGSPYAHHRLGEMFSNGQELGKDEEQALKYYRNAAKEGYEPSQEILGQAYAEGLLGLPKDSEQSKFWLDKARNGDGQPLI